MNINRTIGAISFCLQNNVSGLKKLCCKPFLACRLTQKRSADQLSSGFEFTQIKAVTSCSTHKIDQQETDG